MSTLFASKIIGTGSAFPEQSLKNSELVKQLADQGIETSDEWIQERTGVKERRVSRKGDSREFNSSLGFQSAQRALEMANKKPEDIDQIVYATCSGDTPIPSTACWLQQKLGAKNAWGFDLNAACSGFVYGLALADQAISSGQVKTSLVVGTDILTSTLVNWSDRSTCILFGDASGAVVLERTESAPKNSKQSQILSSHLSSDGSLWELFHVAAGGSSMELTPDRYEQNLHRMQMKGREIFKIATKTLAEFAIKAVEANGYQVSDIDWVIPHQANIRIIEAAAKRLKIPMEKIIVNVERYGNTSAATVPTALDEAVRDGRIKKGQLVLLDVFGAGLTYGSTLIRW